MTRATAIPAYSAEDAAEMYVEAKMGSAVPISTAAAVRALRTLLTDCPLSDHELATLVAEAAIAEGLNVSFDGDPEDEGFPMLRIP